MLNNIREQGAAVALPSSTILRELEPAPHLQTLVQLTSFVECDEVLRSRDFVQGSHTESAPFFGMSLIKIDGDEHFERRRLESPLFSKAALEYYETEALAPHVETVISWAADRQRADDGIVRVDLAQMLRKILARITATVTGIDGVEGEASTERFFYFVGELGAGATVEWSTENHEEVIRRILVVRDEFVREFFAPSLERRRHLVDRFNRGELAEEQLPRDLLTLLLRNWQHDWEDELILRESTLYYVAATQTTTHTAPHVLRHLDAWLAHHPEDRVRVTDPAFLKAAAYESLRLHVPVPALLRLATSDVELSTGRRIAAGERVACCFGPANRDPDTFGPDALVFNPHRNVGSAKPWGLSFGGGPHMCIGRALATGLSARTDGTESTEGTIVRIVKALYEAGVELDPDDPPQYTEASHIDAYSRFPIRLMNL